MHKGTEHLGSVSFCFLKPDGDICKEGEGGDSGAEKGKVGEAEFEKARMATKQRGQIGVGREGDKRRHYCLYKVLCTSPPLV